MSFQHILLMRFSYPALGGFRLSKGGVDRVRAALYNPERLERRFALFEKLTLPSLLNQNPHNCEIAIIIGNDLPRPYRARLETLVAPLARARLFPLPPIKNEAAHVVAALRTDKVEHLATTRLDDDDALALDCLAKIERICQTVMDTKLVPLPLCIAFNNGLFLKKSPNGLSLYGAPQKTPIGIGLTLLAPRTLGQTVYTRNHRSVGACWNCITDATSLSFIRSVHDDNDSGAWADGPVVEYTDTQLHDILARRFGINLERLRTF